MNKTKSKKSNWEEKLKEYNKNKPRYYISAFTEGNVPVISHFEHTYAESLEMQLIITRCYLYAHNCFKANETF